MSPHKIILCQLQSPRLIRSCRKLLGTGQIFLIASLLLSSFGQAQIVAVNKTENTSALTKSTVQEPPPFLAISNDADYTNLTRIYLDAHLAGYASQDIALNIKWPFENASKVWAYVKKTFGSYGPDSHIYVFFYGKVDNKAMDKSKSYYLTHFNEYYDFKNVVELRKQSEVVWAKKVNQTSELINFTFLVGHIVESASKNTKGSPGYNNYIDNTYRSLAWTDIFVYNVFSELGMQQVAESYKAVYTSSFLTQNDEDVEDSLVEDDRVNWIQNWFWPIYLKFGGAQALIQFFTNCYSHFPRKLLNRTDTKGSLYYEYTETIMSKGVFVHFWSGSVGIDLRDLADFAFTWDDDDQWNFQAAQESYPMLKYQNKDNNFEQLLVLDQLGTGVQNNVLSNSKTDKRRPAIAVISEQINDVNEPIRKRVKGTLYRPLNQSERYLYDGQNELHVFETQYGVCYYITCSARYIIKWVTNIPLDENLFFVGCPTIKYLNSRRLQDPTYLNANSQDQGHETLNTMYSIQFLAKGAASRYNMGLLKCESIQNSTHSVHIYLTEKKINPNEYKFPTKGAELFWSPNSDKTLIVPCIGTSLKMIPSLQFVNFETDFYNDSTKWKTIWDRQNKTLDSESLGYNVSYDPVIGFTLAYDIWPFEDMSYTKKNIYFECVFYTESKMRYKVYVTSLETELKSEFTIVDEQFQISSEASGCFLVKNSDRFLFVGNKTDYENDPLKLISCSTPNTCDLFRRCLDSAGSICNLRQQELQAARLQLKKPHSNGLLRCFDYQWDIGHKPIYEYTFVGLNKIRYVLSENVPKEAIIYLDESLPILYTNVLATFRCQIATFVLVPNIRFLLVFSNQTNVYQNHGNVTPQSRPLPFLSSKYGVYDTNDASSVMSVNVRKGIGWTSITLNLTAEVVGVMCSAPLHNSTEWVNVTRSFVAKDIKIPKIEKKGKTIRHIFDKDDKDFNLYCKSSGAPDPKIKWILPNTFPALENTFVTDNPYLKFPLMKETFAGTYTCVASNSYGNDMHDFRVEYQESGIGWQEKTGIGFTVGFLMLLLTSIVLLLFKYYNTKRKLRDLTKEEIIEFTHGVNKASNSGYNYANLKSQGKIDIRLLPFDKKFILDPQNLMIEIGVILGRGNSGIVYRGLLNGYPVAVKTLKSTADVASVKSLLGELKIMSFIGDHDHVVHFFGAVIEKIQQRVVEAVVELSPFGNLKNYLKDIFDSVSRAELKLNDLLDNDKIVSTLSTTNCIASGIATTLSIHVCESAITTLTLVDWCRQIASGMNFLALKRVYHGDLAARNILVFENRILKISDFGMSKQLYFSANYVKKEKIALPWRWMAMETLNFQEFSIESDVWAFGVTIWEIFSLGKIPFPGLGWNPEFVNILSTGMRMAKPKYCSKSIYDEMLKCWSEKPKDRPTFAQLTDFFTRILEEHETLSSNQKAEDQEDKNK